jgi:hypothetical protein
MLLKAARGNETLPAHAPNKAGAIGLTPATPRPHDKRAGAFHTSGEAENRFEQPGLA